MRVRSNHPQFYCLKPLADFWYSNGNRRKRSVRGASAAVSGIQRARGRQAGCDFGEIGQLSYDAMTFQESPQETSGWTMAWGCIWPYAATLLGVAGATALCQALTPLLGEHGVFLFYLFPLIWAGWRYSKGPFIAGTAAAAVAGMYVVSNAQTFRLALDDWLHLLAFLGVAGALLWLTARERTSRHTLEETAERLRLSEGQFRAIFAAEPVGVAQVERAGAWVSVNAALCRMLGYTEKELVGKKIEEVTHPEHRQEGKARIKELMAGKISSANWQKRYVRKDGSTLWVHASVAPVCDEAGQVRFAVAVLQDITEIVAAREVLARDNEQLEALVEERTASLQEMTRHMNFLLYTIAHDLRAPLRAQHGYSDLLLLKFSPVLDKTGVEYLH